MISFSEYVVYDVKQVSSLSLYSVLHYSRLFKISLSDQDEVFGESKVQLQVTDY